MRELEQVPDTMKRVALVAVVAYFVTWIFAQSTGNPLLFVVSEVLFGLLALGLGGLLYVQAGRGDTALLIAGVCLGAGGGLQLLFVASLFLPVALGVIGGVASLFVFAGIGAYVYAIWVDR